MRADRILLRALEPSDAPVMVKASRSGTLANVNDDYVHPLDPASIESVLTSLDYGPHTTNLSFAIELLPTRETPGEMVGWCGLGEISWQHQRARLDISIPNKAHRGLGYGTESILLLFQLAFDQLALQKISVSTTEYNARAFRCLKRVGFVMECCRREAHFYGGRYHDLVVMSILEHEYRKLHGYEGLRLLGYTERQIGQLGSATHNK